MDYSLAVHEGQAVEQWKQHLQSRTDVLCGSFVRVLAVSDRSLSSEALLQTQCT